MFFISLLVDPFLRYGSFIAPWGTHTHEKLPNDLYSREIIYSSDIRPTLLKDATSCWFGVPTIIGFYDGESQHSLLERFYNFGSSLPMSTVIAQVCTARSTKVNLILGTPYDTNLKIFTKRVKEQIASETDPKMYWFADKPPTYFFEIWDGMFPIFFFSYIAFIFTCALETRDDAHSEYKSDKSYPDSEDPGGDIAECDSQVSESEISDTTDCSQISGISSFGPGFPEIQSADQVCVM